MSRLAGLAGLVTLLCILGGEIIGPTIVAGQRVSGTLDESAIRAYFSHAAIAPFTIIAFLAAGTALVLFAGLHDDLRFRGANPFYARLALLFAVANVPLYLVAAALSATLVTLATTGGSLMATFRFWDVYYNSGGYVFEIGYVLFFSLAMRSARGWPRWISNLGLVVALAQAVNFFALWIGAPDASTLPGNVLLLVFLGSLSVNLLRRRVGASSATGAFGEPTTT